MYDPSIQAAGQKPFTRSQKSRSDANRPQPPRRRTTCNVVMRDRAKAAAADRMRSCLIQMKRSKDSSCMTMVNDVDRQLRRIVISKSEARVTSGRSPSPGCQLKISPYKFDIRATPPSYSPSLLTRSCKHPRHQSHEQFTTFSILRQDTTVRQHRSL